MSIFFSLPECGECKRKGQTERTRETDCEGVRQREGDGETDR